MTKLTCEICIDLMPLVQDGVASRDSVVAVEEHLKNCPECRALFDGQIPQPSNSNQILKKVQQKLQIFIGMILMFGVFFGLSLTASSEQFLNAWIMPVIGCIGYYLFRWKSIYFTPCLLLITHLITNTFGLIRGVEHLDILTLIVWTAIYAFFACIGTIIAGLLHFALRKEDSYEKEKS